MTSAGKALQLDLFGAVVAAEHKEQAADQQRRIDGLTCLRDAVPEALQVVTELRYTRREDSRSPRADGGWAWCISKAGLRFEPATEWWTGARDRGEPWGWDRTPARLLTWDELSHLVGADPRQVEVRRQPIKKYAESQCCRAASCAEMTEERRTTSGMSSPT